MRKFRPCPPLFERLEGLVSCPRLIFEHLAQFHQDRISQLLWANQMSKDPPKTPILLVPHFAAWKIICRNCESPQMLFGYLRQRAWKSAKEKTKSGRLGTCLLARWLRCNVFKAFISYLNNGLQKISRKLMLAGMVVWHYVWVFHKMRLFLHFLKCKTLCLFNWPVAVSTDACDIKRPQSWSHSWHFFLFFLPLPPSRPSPFFPDCNSNLEIEPPTLHRYDHVQKIYRRGSRQTHGRQWLVLTAEIFYLLNLVLTNDYVLAGS